LAIEFEPWYITMMEVDMRFSEFVDLPELKDLVITGDGSSGEVLREGKWVSGRLDRNIRIDPPSHGVGQTHAHVLGRKGEELGVVNFDGSASHGTKCRLSVADANALRARGFQIPQGNIVEWVLLQGECRLLLG
jgi:hypothetical protein